MKNEGIVEDDATKKPVPDVKSDELSETDVAKVTGGSWGEAQTGTMSTRTGKTNPITLIE